jgi:SAM-dependent methyltransferase
VAREDRFGADWSGPMVTCSSCGCAYLSEPPAPDELSALYDRYYTRYEELLAPEHPPRVLLLDRSRLLRRIFRRGGPSPADLWGIRGPRVLDFGCHDGRLVDLLCARGLDAWGYDPHAANAARPRVLDGDRDNLPQRVGAVDDILLSHVIEHLTDPLETLRFLSTMLRPGGRIQVRVPNLSSPFRRVTGTHWMHWHAPFHLQHLSPGSLDHLAARAGLERVTRRVYTPGDWAVASLRSWLRPPVSLPDRRLHAELSTEMLLVARALTAAIGLFGGDALDVVYRKRA